MSDPVEPPKDEFLRREEVSAFWDQARAGRGEDQETGYLGDEWPPSLALDRFAGEWRRVTDWLDRYQVPRGACLDVGCGTGLWLEHLAGRFERAEGIDLSQEMVASAQARLARRGLSHCAVSQASITDLEANRGRYDLIFVGGVLMYLNDDAVAPTVARLRDLLSPGGVIILRESTHLGRTRYRDQPLAPGLFADPAAARPPYRAVYRPPRVYAELLAAQGLVVRHTERNRAYKLADITEAVLKAWNRAARGGLGRDRARAERVAALVHRHRWLFLLPAYFAMRPFARWAWKIDNHFYVCARS